MTNMLKKMKDAMQPSASETTNIISDHLSIISRNRSRREPMKASEYNRPLVPYAGSRS